MNRRKFVKTLGVGGAGATIPTATVGSSSRAAALEEFLAACQTTGYGSTDYSVGRVVIANRKKLEAIRKLGVEGRYRTALESWVAHDNLYYGNCTTIEEVDALATKRRSKSIKESNSRQVEDARDLLAGEHDSTANCSVCGARAKVRNYNLLTSVGVVKIKVCLKHHPPTDLITSVGEFAHRKRPTKGILDFFRRRAG